VALRLASVTSGLVAPGVHAASGRGWPFSVRLWQLPAGGAGGTETFARELLRWVPLAAVRMPVSGPQPASARAVKATHAARWVRRWAMRVSLDLRA
jgi:hypothetical protein